jgi:hypothetical protein
MARIKTNIAVGKRTFRLPKDEFSSFFVLIRAISEIRGCLAFFWSDRTTRLFAVFAPCLLVFTVAGQGRCAEPMAKQSGANRTLFGFTSFPYDQTLEAMKKTHEIVVENSTIYALHFDDGIPWKEALADAPFPARIQKKWDDQARDVPKRHKIYLGLAPLEKDRKSIAHATGDQEKIAMPDYLRNAPLDDPKIKQAYLNYARRAVKQFKPDFLNLGIEAGGILMGDAVRWPQFVRLYEHVRAELKKEFPNLQIGISFSLGQLRVEANAKAAKALVEQSDYLGLSFYPSASAFDEKFGLPAYGKGSDAWKKPLAWARAYTDKPIALCETGYTTRDSDVPQFDLHIKGDVKLQEEFVRELFQTAERDHYAFVIWFLAVDYDKLYARMPKGSEAMQLWRNIGLFDGELQPKPAWKIWQAGIAK